MPPVSPIACWASGFIRARLSLKASPTDRSLPLSPAARDAALRQIYQDALHSANLRDHEATVITGLMLMLYARRGVHQATIAAAMAEQAAHTKLAEQAHSNVAAAPASLARVEATVQYHARR
jgi:hypothetical protein